MNYCITMFIYLCIYFYIFLNSFFLEDLIGNKCAIMCFNVFILGNNIHTHTHIYIYICAYFVICLCIVVQLFLSAYITMCYQINSLTQEKKA